jgi:hypothetical protein
LLESALLRAAHHLWRRRCGSPSRRRAEHWS